MKDLTVFAGALGRRMIDGTCCRFGDEIRPGDFVDGDFDAKTVHTGGGLYLVECVENGRVTWMGCRRLTRRPDGIEIAAPDGDPETVPDLASIGWRVAGTVRQVFRGKAV